MEVAFAVEADLTVGADVDFTVGAAAGAEVVLSFAALPIIPETPSANAGMASVSASTSAASVMMNLRGICISPQNE